MLANVLMTTQFHQTSELPEIRHHMCIGNSHQLPTFSEFVWMIYLSHIVSGSPVYALWIDLPMLFLTQERSWRILWRPCSQIPTSSLRLQNSVTMLKNTLNNSQQSVSRRKQCDTGTDQSALSRSFNSVPLSQGFTWCFNPEVEDAGFQIPYSSRCIFCQHKIIHVTWVDLVIPWFMASKE